MGSTPITQLRCDLRVKYAGAGAVLILVAVLAADVVAAQAGDKYTARLGWVPTAGPNDRVNVTGKGTATATSKPRTMSSSIVNISVIDGARTARTTMTNEASARPIKMEFGLA